MPQAEISFYNQTNTEWGEVPRKAEKAMGSLAKDFATGKIHGCGRVHCCLEFELNKGRASNFTIKRKRNAPNYR